MANNVKTSISKIQTIGDLETDIFFQRKGGDFSYTGVVRDISVHKLAQLISNTDISKKDNEILLCLEFYGKGSIDEAHEVHKEMKEGLRSEGQYFFKNANGYFSKHTQKNIATFEGIKIDEGLSKKFVTYSITKDDGNSNPLENDHVKKFVANCIQVAHKYGLEIPGIVKEDLFDALGISDPTIALTLESEDTKNKLGNPGATRRRVTFADDVEAGRHGQEKS